MTLTLNTQAAKAADNVVSSIRESGKYVGIITRAEKLKSQNHTEGFGLSFKTDDGATADYLDIWTIKSNGETLRGNQLVHAILACLKMREAPEGEIECVKWDADSSSRKQVRVPGYPTMMGKRLGLLLQEEWSTNANTGKDMRRMQIFGVFQADTELVSSEILESKTRPEKLSRMVEVLAARPVRDVRQKTAHRSTGSGPNERADDPGFDTDIPFVSSAFAHDAILPNERRMSKYRF